MLPDSKFDLNQFYLITQGAHIPTVNEKILTIFRIIELSCFRLYSNEAKTLVSCATINGK